MEERSPGFKNGPIVTINGTESGNLAQQSEFYHPRMLNLANNMTIDENQTHSVTSPKGVIMQVNKYVPHYQRIP
jgi:hypothetical protein